MDKSNRADEMKEKLVFESDPKILVEKLIKIVEVEKHTNGATHQSRVHD